MVKNEEDSEIEEICSKYSDLLGNRVLLLGSTNQEVGNSRYSRKLAGYSVTDGFSELVTSEEINSDLEDDNSVYLKKYGQYREHMNMGTDFDTLDLVDSDEDSVDEETIREEIQDLEPIIKEYNGRWTINRVKNNSANLLRELAELIDFSNCTSNNVNFESSLYDTDEFEDIGYTNIVEQELEDLRGLIEYNHRRSVRI